MQFISFLVVATQRSNLNCFHAKYMACMHKVRPNYRHSQVDSGFKMLQKLYWKLWWRTSLDYIHASEVVSFKNFCKRVKSVHEYSKSCTELFKLTTKPKYTGIFRVPSCLYKGKKVIHASGNMIVIVQLQRAKRHLDTIRLNLDEWHCDVLPTSKAILMQMGYKGKLVFWVIRKKWDVMDFLKTFWLTRKVLYNGFSKKNIAWYIIGFGTRVLNH